MNVLLAHEWLERTGGSENSFEEICKVFPKARRVCLWNNAPQRFGDEFEETFLARTPLRRSKALSLLFMDRAWRSVSLDQLSSVIASSHAFSHHLAARAAEQGIDSFAYVYTPARYIWESELDARGETIAARLGRGYFRRIDRAHVSEHVNYIAISQFVRERIARSWGVDSAVIYPPVDTATLLSHTDWASTLSTSESSVLDALPNDFVLGASRFVEYKRLDAAIAVGEELELPVVLCGAGPDGPRLEALASDADVPVHFVGEVSNRLLYSLYQRATLFVFMAIEDFGIMPVEAMTLGTPVLVRDQGGAKESAELLGGGVASSMSSRPELADRARAAIGMGSVPVENVETAFSSLRFATQFEGHVASCSTQ